MKCEHPSDDVVADILQADSKDHRVRWCRRCGAYAVGHILQGEGHQPANFTEWRAPGGAVLPEGARGTLESAEVKAREIGRLLNGIMPPGWGYVVLLASFGENGFWTYISSIDRADTVGLLKDAARTIAERKKSL